MKNKIKKRAALFLGCVMAVAIFSFSNGCKKSSDDNPTPSGPGTNEVWLQNSKFSPSSITVSVNTTVTWSNKDNMEHTVTSNTGVFSSDTLTANTGFSFKFTAPGTYPYFCVFHSGMTGTVIVQ